MRNVGLLAFGITTAVLVPAAVQRLTAGSTQMAKLVAPDSHSLVIEGTKIDASLDRAIVDPGEAVKLTLRAHAATGKAGRVAVGVLVLGSTGDEGSRVPSPPVGVAHRTVTLEVGPDGTGTKEIAIPLRGAKSFDQPLAHYQVMVMAPKAAARLEYLRGHARLVGDDDEGIPDYNQSGVRFMSLYWSVGRGEAPGNPQEIERAEDKLYAPDGVAVLAAHTRPRSAAIAIAAPDTAHQGETFTVAVTVKNTTRRELSDLEVTLEAPAGLLDDGYLGMTDKAVVISEHPKLDLGAGQTQRVEFTVTASEVGVIGLYARATCDDCKYGDVLAQGAFEATEVVAAEGIVVGTSPLAAKSAPVVGTR